MSGGISFLYGCVCKEWLKSVEEYDHHENKWTYLPDMIKERCNHAPVSMGNKMFVIGGWNINSCELFDNISRRFVKLQELPEGFRALDFQKRTICVGSKIMLFIGKDYCTSPKIFMYDINTNDWKVKESNFNVSACVKVPSV